jgi:hypothetical protein
LIFVFGDCTIISALRGGIGILSPKNEDARDRSLWRLNGDEPAGYLNHTSSHSAFRLSLRVAPNSRVFQLGRRWSLGLPRFPHLSAALVAKLRVAPALASPAPPSMSLRVAPNRHPPACLRPISGFPQISTFRLASGVSLRVAPAAAPFGLPRDGFPGCPGLSVPRRRLQADLRVSPNFAPSSGTASASSERSESCVYGWADDDFPARLELCILGPRPRMNLRVQSGLARSCSALNALSISCGLPLP